MKSDSFPFRMSTKQLHERGIAEIDKARAALVAGRIWDALKHMRVASGAIQTLERVRVGAKSD